MSQIPYVFKNVVRKRYFEIFKIFIEDVDLVLDMSNYKNDVLVDPRQMVGPGIVAIVESHSPWGEPDILIKERIKRNYDGLRIHVINDNYRYKIEQIAYNIKRNLLEDVIIA